MTHLLPSLIIGIIALDTTIAFQILLSQPIFACPIIGWLLGNPQLGFEIGVIMQLLWLHILPVGSTVFPEGNIASMVICAISIQFDHLPYPNLVFTAAVLLGVLVSYAGAWMTVLDRKINGALLGSAEKAAERVRIRQIKLIEALGILIYFVLMTLLAYCGLILAEIVINSLQSLFSSSLEEMFVMIKPVMFGIGIMFTLQLISKSMKNLTL